jgi:4-hydroxy-3-polyprenylbenzoate decarboxylase
MSIIKFVNKLDQRGQLIRIKSFVDPVFEIAEITDRISKQTGGGKALLFENTATGFACLTNAMGSEERIRLALNVNDLDEAINDVENVFKAALSNRNWTDKLQTLLKLGRIASFMPKSIKGKGACQDVIHRNPNLDILPVLKCWELDGGRFITLPMVHTKDPNTGIRNLGMYIMQVIDSKTTAMHWHQHKTGARHYREYQALCKRMPIAVALGGDPIYTYAATAPLPDNIDEYILAGVLRKQTVKMVKCITQDIEVPEDVDIVIEGYVDTSEDLFWEGPFGDHTGFYSLPDWYPKFHVTCITHRKDAIYPATIVGIPPQEDAWIQKASERIFLKPLKLAILPELQDINIPAQGTAHNLTLIKIEKTYRGQGLKAIHSLWGAGQMMLNKILLVTDFPLTDYYKLTKNTLQRIDFHNDLIFSRGPLDVLDHSSDDFAFGSKIGIDVTNSNTIQYTANHTKPIRKPNQSNIVAFNCPPEFDELLMILSVKEPNTTLVGNICKELFEDENLSQVKLFILLDDTVDIFDLETVCWLVCSNIDPQRDIRIADAPRGQIVIDACMKLPHTYNFQRTWPNVVTSSKEIIKTVDEKWNTLGIKEFVSSPSNKFSRLNNF